ncbi:putative methyltransferase C9orf114 homolog [Halyomorpha halys]|uniref:putative methyltransferase C9orf114 homolog n=1 Tax=Halyomorpha halys TaxID=286706 RepID=UPI0006D527C0|nr:putative methyltransferase C9orf114 homolog [Halyomorpha halys]
MPPIVPKSWREHKNIVKSKKWRKTEKYLETLKKQNEELLKNGVTEELKTDIMTRAVPSLKTAPTLSIAIPGSILDNAQTQEFRSYLAGQIARAACIYNITEIIIFDDTVWKKEEDHFKSNAWKSCQQMVNILKYLECPQYLRKRLFPMCDDLKYVGLLNPLDAPHHLRTLDESPYREGVITETTTKSGNKSYCDIGLERQVRTNTFLPKSTRVTLKLKKIGEKLRGEVVDSTVPTKEAGLYWGYKVRLAERLSDVFIDSPYGGEYDLTIGTSDKGDPVSTFTVPEFEHALIVLGGVKGLEYALTNDHYTYTQVDEVSLMFDAYLNTCPSQGARTIRTEEALLISLAVITPKLGLP